MIKNIHKPNEFKAWIGVFDFDCSPVEITKQLGIEPTETRIKGEYRIVSNNNHKMLNKSNSWLLKSKLSMDQSIDKHLEYLLEKIRPQKSNFIKLSSKYLINLNCAIYYYETNPGISLNKTLIKEIAELNIPLNFDIYCLGE